MISRVVIFFTVVTFACAATWMGRLPPAPKELAHKEGCYVPEIKDVIPFGAEHTPIGNCVRINCSRQMIYYASCGVVQTNDPNLLVTREDLSKPYPECCPTVKSVEENNVI